MSTQKNILTGVIAALVLALGLAWILLTNSGQSIMNAVFALRGFFTLAVGLSCVLIALVVEWKTILRYRRIENESLGDIERYHPRLPGKIEIAIATIFTIVFILLFFEFATIVYAMSFTLSSSSAETKDTRDMVVADFDNDGDLDYFAGNTDTGAPTYGFDAYSNDGAGNFTYVTTINGGSLFFTKFVAGDVDNDGDVDLVYGQAGVSYTVGVKKNNGSFSFSQGYSYGYVSPIALVEDVVLADVDNDGDLDIIAITSSNVTNAVHINDGHGNFAAAQSTLPSAKGALAADFDSDGDIDLVLRNASANLRIYRNSGTGAFVQYQSIGVLSANIATFAVADAEGDGDIDIFAIGNAAPANFNVTLNDGTGYFTANSESSVYNYGVQDIATADFDNDGDIDFLDVGSEPGPVLNGNELWLNTGLGGFSSHWQASGIDETSSSLAVGDLDSDGDLDYVLGRSGVTANGVLLSDQAATVANTAPSAPGSLTAVLLSRLNKVLSFVTLASQPQAHRIIVPADGKPFMAYHDTATSQIKTLKCGNRTCTSGNTTTTISGITSSAIAVAIASDGLPIIVYQDTGLKVVKCSNATCSSFTTEYFLIGAYGTYPSIAIPADGQPVISTYKSDTGDLYMIKCGDSDCSTGTPYAIDTTNNIGSYSTIGIGSDGYPIIAYLDSTNDGVKVAKCSNAICSSVSINSVGSASAGNGVSMVIPADGNPFIAHASVLIDSLFTIKCSNPQCSSWTSGSLGSGNGASYPRLALGSDGNPIVIFTDQSDVVMAKCNSSTCASATQTTVFDDFGSYVDITKHDDGMPVLAHVDTNADRIQLILCGNAACNAGGTDGTYTYRLMWGSGSDIETSTRLLQYQVKVGTGSSTHNIVSGKTASPTWVTRTMPNGQSKMMVLKNLACGNTYYWSVATVDTGFRTAWSSEEEFTLDSSCNFNSGGGGSSSSEPSVGGGLSIDYFRTNRPENGSSPDRGLITVTGFKDLDGNGRRGAKELPAFKGLSFTASGRTVEDIPVHKTAALNDKGQATFDLPLSDDRGYWILADTGSALLDGFRATGQTASGGYVIKTGSKLYAEFGFQRSDILSYKPCLAVGVPSTKETKGSDAEILLQRLEDAFSQKVVRGVDRKDELISRKDFFTMLARTHCVPLLRDAAELEQSSRLSAKNLGIDLPLIDLPLDPSKPESLLLHSLIAAGVDITRQTHIGSAADLSSPITREEAVRATYAVLNIPDARRVKQGGVLPDDIEPTDSIATQLRTLQSLGVLPESFLPILSASYGMDQHEAALLLVRAAFRGGKINLLPEVYQPKKGLPSTPTFLSVLPPLKQRACLEKDTERASSIGFSDVLPGDVVYESLRDLLTRGTKNSAKQTLWLLTGTRRTTEFGIMHGQTRVGLDEPVSILEVVRNLLVLACVPPETASDVMSGKDKIDGRQGSAEMRVARDRISGLSRDASFASRIFYRAQDHQKEFDLSVFTYLPEFLRMEERKPSVGLSVTEGSRLLASGLLMIEVKNNSLTPLQAENAMEELSAAIRKDLLGKDVDWRDESALKAVPLTRGMLLKFLSTVVTGAQSRPVVPPPSTLPLGEIWWERIK